VRYRDCARFTLCAIGTWAIGLVRYRELCQFFVCYRVGALSHRALTEPTPHAVATVLAGWPPLEFLADMYAEVYRREREIHEGATRTKLPTKAKKIIRIQARRSIIERWDVHLSDPHTAGRRTVEAVRPYLSEWIDRAQGEVTLRLTQVLTWMFRKVPASNRPGAYHSVPPLRHPMRHGAAHPR